MRECVGLSGKLTAALVDCAVAVSVGSKLYQCLLAANYSSVCWQQTVAVSVGSKLYQCLLAANYRSVCWQQTVAVSVGSKL
jgi:hypothetical protein